MSGVYGIVDSRAKADLRPQLTAMTESLTHRPWYRHQCHVDPAHGLAVGHLGIGVFNAGPQPVWNAAGTVAVIMAGELYGPAAPLADPNQAVLAAYERAGTAFAGQLDGTFVAAVWDQPRRTLLLASDRFGTYPTYYACQAGRLRFAPEVRAVLLDSALSRALDLTALAQYMRFQHLLSRRTFFESVSLLPPGSTLVFDARAGAAVVTPYWRFEEVVRAPASVTSFEAAADEAAALMLAAVRRRFTAAPTTGQFISGGLDSRTILAACVRAGQRPVTVTYGMKNSNDVYYATRVAQRAQTPHHLVEYVDGRWVEPAIDFHLALTEGFHSWIHLHGINVFQTPGERYQVNLSGFAGDTILGGWCLDPALGELPDDTAFMAQLFYDMNQRYNWPGITEAEEHLLYHPTVRPGIARRAFDSLMEDTREHLGLDNYARLDFFGEYFSDMRHFLMYSKFIRPFVEMRYPFLDYALTEFLWRLPPAYRIGRRMEKAVLHRLAPGLALVPVDKDETLPTPQKFLRTAHGLWTKARRRATHYWQRLFPARFSLHTDYEGWLRGELRPWGEAVVQDPRTLDRGIFNPDFIRSIWARHQSGQEQWTIGKLAPLMTVELMLRRYDGDR